MNSTTTLMTEIGPLTVKVVRSLAMERPPPPRPLKYKDGDGDTIMQMDLSAFVPSPQDLVMVDYTVTFSGPKGSFSFGLDGPAYAELLRSLGLLNVQPIF